MSRKSFDQIVAEYQESQREKSPLEQSAGARWQQFQMLMEHGNDAATQQYLDSVLKSEYGLLSGDESIALENVTEDTFFDAALQHEMREREKERLKQEGEELLQEYCNDNNRDVTSSCAICDQSAVQCLCSFEMSPIEREDVLYSWKATPNAPIWSSFLVLANQDQKASLSYTIVGTCIHGKTDCCTLTYAQRNPKKGAEEKKEAKEATLELEFEMDAIVGEESEESPYYISYNEAKGVHPLRDEKSPLILGPDQLPDFTVGGFVTSFKRAFSLASTSKIDCMPATVYDVMITECADDQYIPRNYVRTYLLPQYEVDFGLVLDFNGGIDFSSESGQKYSEMGLSIEGYLTEKIFSNKTIEYKTEVKVTQAASHARKQLEDSEGFLSTFLKMLTLLEKVKVPMKSFSALPMTISFIFPKIKIEGNCSIEYAPTEDNSDAAKSTLNKSQNSIQVKREKTKIEADPLLGGTFTLDILEMLASVLSAGAGKVIRQAMKYQGKYGRFTATADLVATLSGGGHLEIESSLVNEWPEYKFVNLRCNIGIGLDAKIEAGIRSFVFNAAFTAGFKVKAKCELGFYTNSENKELGWYFGTNGAALYWTLIFSFGIGGEDGEYEEGGKGRDDYGSTSIDGSGIANSEKDDWDESLARQSEEELKKTQKYLYELEAMKRGDLIPKDENIRQDLNTSSLNDIINRRNQVDSLIKGRSELTKYIDELTMLTKKYEQQGGYLSPEDNSRRLALKVEVEKIYQNYGVPTVETGNLDSKQEYDLLQQRKKELDQIIKENSLNIEAQREYEDMVMGRTHKNPVAADVRKRRLEAEAELDNITDADYETTGKVVLIESSIFAYDNLVSKDLQTIKKEMMERLDD